MSRVLGVEVSAQIGSLTLKEPFVIARDTTTEAEVVWVEIEHEGERGYGEAEPIDRYEESAESALAYRRGGRGLARRRPVRARGDRVAPAASGRARGRAAIDAALHDLCGKLRGRPGLAPARAPAGRAAHLWTIGLGDPDDDGAQGRARAAAFERLKLKLGGRDGLDVERVRAVRGVTDEPIQVDVNEYWTLDEALDSIPQLAGARRRVRRAAAAGRRPRRAGAEARARRFRSTSTRTATRSPTSPPARERAHGINIKLAKSGGIREAVRMAHAARALGLGVMLGCMVESGLGIAAGAQVASLCDHVDLDGNLLLAEDPWPGVQLVDGVQLPSDARRALASAA